MSLNFFIGLVSAIIQQSSVSYNVICSVINALTHLQL